eukprot:GFYU01004073.1.p1 GENE.GFYU01004073.1~~GFYU01004073.1.p1  ORF type:complete len:451 (-),score=90.59 GFYU01004073.1:61-1413(-)
MATEEESAEVLFVRSETGVAITLVSVVFASIITFWLVYKHLQYYTVPELQKFIIRILFIVPLYAIESWLSLYYHEYSLWFDTIRDVYEAFVIYNFLILCMKVLGGDSEVIHKIQSRQLLRSWLWCTCCLPQFQLDSLFIRRMKQGTLQYVVIKPLMTIVTLVLHAKGLYHDGEMRFDRGYVYVSFIVNISVCISLYCLVLFYMATADLLAPFQPVLKFLVVKGVIFLSFWQSVGLAGLAKMGLIKDYADSTAGEIAVSYQDFLICHEMLIAAILCVPAFTYKQFKEPSAEDGDEENSSGNKKTVLKNMMKAASMRDVIQDTMHNFSPVYQEYVLQNVDDDSPVNQVIASGAKNRKKKKYRAKTYLLSHQRMQWLLGKASEEEKERLMLTDDETYNPPERGRLSGFKDDAEITDQEDYMLGHMMTPIMERKPVQVIQPGQSSGTQDEGEAE